MVFFLLISKSYFMEVMPMRHKRSMSDFRMRKSLEECLSCPFEPSYDNKLEMGLESCIGAKKRPSLGTEVQKILKQEILHLQKQLEDQFFERYILEKALTNEALHHDLTNKYSVSKRAEDLINEISVLEFEVVYLEKYILSLYRKRFQEKISNFSKLNQGKKYDTDKEKWNFTESQAYCILTKDEKSTKLKQDLLEKPSMKSGELSKMETIIDSSIHRSHSSLSHRFDRSIEKNYYVGIQSEALNPYHSLPLSMFEPAQGDYTSRSNSLGDHLRKNIQDHISETPNWISEEMIKIISFIYMQLVNPPIMNHNFPSSPNYFPSPPNDSSPNKWKLDETRNSVFPSWIENNINEENSKEFNGYYGSVVEVLRICRDSKNLSHVKQKLQLFRSFVSKLEKVDLKRMKHEEKLAFWINVHNALVMHAYLVHGISNNSMKRISFILKAAYNVGGHAISVDMIQNLILGCRQPRPGQWLHSFFNPTKRFKIKDARRAYAIEHPEPRLYFALCSGSHSDPWVRLYTPKTIFQDLEAAKEDYIQTTLRVTKQGKILLPKIVDLFSKESNLCPSSFMEMFGFLIPISLRKSLQEQKNQSGNFWKRIQWVPHDFTFRFLLSKELFSRI